jgi:hypothetical protein
VPQNHGFVHSPHPPSGVPAMSGWGTGAMAAIILAVALSFLVNYRRHEVHRA